MLYLQKAWASYSSKKKSAMFVRWMSSLCSVNELTSLSSCRGMKTNKLSWLSCAILTCRSLTHRPNHLLPNNCKARVIMHYTLYIAFTSSLHLHHGLCQSSRPLCLSWPGLGSSCCGHKVNPQRSFEGRPKNLWELSFGYDFFWENSHSICCWEMFGRCLTTECFRKIMGIYFPTFLMQDFGRYCCK